MLLSETARRLAAGVLMAVLTMGALLGYTHTAPEPAAEDSPVSTQATAAPATSTAFITPATTRAPLPDAPQVSAQGAMIFDLISGRELYSKNPLERLYPASLTKLLTAVTVLENGGGELTYTVGDEIRLIQPHSTTARLKQGQRLDLSMLLAAMLLPSGNDAAYVAAAGVGRHIAGDASLSAEEAVAVFVRKMNDTARELGMDRSVFRNPDGYHDPLHYTTVRDLTALTRKALEYPEIRETVGLQRASFTLLSGEAVTWHNTNQLIHPDGELYYHGCYGIKTGTTTEARACLAAAARRGDMDLLVIVLRCADNETRWADAAALLDYGFVLTGMNETG